MKSINLNASQLPSTMLRLWPGLLLTSGLAFLATSLQKLPGINILSPLILAVVLGVLLRNTIGTADIYRPGITFSLKRILRLAIILLGLQLSLAQVLDIGPIGLAIVVVTLVSTFIFTCSLGSYLGVEQKLTRLVAAGTSICGASAVVATSSVVKSSDEDVTYAVAIITVFGTLSMLLYPVLDMMGLDLTSTGFGLWCGASIHEVAQVVAAAFQMGEATGEIATISKLSRVMFLVPMLLGMGFMSISSHKQSKAMQLSKLPIPWFVFGFVALIVLNSFSLFPVAIKDWIIQGNKFLLTIALAAMGLETNLLKIRETGLKPFYLGAASWLFISGLSFGLVKLLY
ncbi:YeiH family putative sulfate export transporter [Nostoc sp. LEGE 06077]|uniref:YeiH family protein n=1 Tax=Nostoc sp. LEGE 06077 TaxID=915325 RepID=UPI00188065CF|nr:YeiH family protein [Nostoc sp. LEGE 06077]MBE9210361.1 YeiH family putative sulfate export transporter [Nostoc sp. LEGE 06077]